MTRNLPLILVGVALLAQTGPTPNRTPGGQIDPCPRLVGLILRPIGLVFRLHGEFMGIGAPGPHFRQLATHHVPLKYPYDDGTEAKESYSSGEPDHPFLGGANLIFEILYVGITWLTAYGLCWWAGWVIWRRWRVDRLNRWVLLRGALLYAVAGAVVWHGFIATQKVLDSL